MEAVEGTQGLRRVVESEWRLFNAYQNLLQNCSEVLDLDWIFDLRKRRMTLLSELVEEVGLRTIDATANVEPKRFSPVGKQCGADICHYLRDLETEHLVELENFSADFYFQPEWKQLVSQKLIPTANENLSQIGERLDEIA